MPPAFRHALLDNSEWHFSEIDVIRRIELLINSLEFKKAVVVVVVDMVAAELELLMLDSTVLVINFSCPRSKKQYLKVKILVR